MAQLLSAPARTPPIPGLEPLDTKDQALMTWFKVDDGLHKHRKRIRCGLDVEGFAALGLWTTAGSWSSDELTDGWVPDDVLDYLAPGIGEQLAKRLERAALWNRVTRDGEEGWQFHEWTDHQPTRDQVLAERAAAALRQKRARDRARDRRDEEGQNESPSRRDSRVTDTATHGEVTPTVTVPPTRPDPTRPSEHPSDVLFDSPPSASPSTPKTKQQRKPTERGTRIPDDFGISQVLRKWAEDEIPGFDIDREFLRFRDYWRAQPGQKGVRTKWDSVFRNWMRRAFDERGPSRPPGSAVATQDRRSSYGSGYPDRNGIATRDVKPAAEPAEVRKARGWMDIEVTTGGEHR
ncbi:hypothetical protein ACH4T9_12475 [Micromonospora sp. NPDC020750]|uniref:hypothetical protein n=1 Tax=unclassified Micromonospora TaxID=2617518 RepID=UPI003794AE58